MTLKDRILSVALQIASVHGLAATTRNAIAARVGCSTGSVSFHYGDSRHLTRAIVEAAIERRTLPVIGAAVAERHPSLSKCDPTLRADGLRAWLQS